MTLVSSTPYFLKLALILVPRSYRALFPYSNYHENLVDHYDYDCYNGKVIGDRSVSRGERTMVLSIADAKRRFSELVKRAAYKGETIAIGSRSKPEAALVSVEELKRLHQLDMANDARLLEQAVRKSTGTVGLEAVLKAWHETHPEEVPSIGFVPSLSPATRLRASARRTAPVKGARRRKR